jgi:predicted amidohydrolase
MMNVAIYQFDTKWLDPQVNLDKVEKVARQVSGNASMLFLQEMFTTGYTMQPSDVPEWWQVECMERLLSIAGDTGVTIAGSIPYQENGSWTNRMIVLGPEGLQAAYDKIQLFRLAGEADVYSAGEETVAFQSGEWLVRPLICYDLRFPYLSFKSPDAHILFYSANWPQTRITHWQTLLKARAIENQCYVIGVNRTGTDNNGYAYPGKSSVISYSGEVLCEMGPEEGLQTIALSMDALSEYRCKLPFLADRKFIW